MKKLGGSPALLEHPTSTNKAQMILEAKHFRLISTRTYEKSRVANLLHRSSTHLTPNSNLDLNKSFMRTKVSRNTLRALHTKRQRYHPKLCQREHSPRVPGAGLPAIKIP